MTGSSKDSKDLSSKNEDREEASPLVPTGQRRVEVVPAASAPDSHGPDSDVKVEIISTSSEEGKAMHF